VSYEKIEIIAGHLSQTQSSLGRFETDKTLTHNASKLSVESFHFIKRSDCTIVTSLEMEPSMKKTLLASAALIVCLYGNASAASLVDLGPAKLVPHHNYVQLADDEGGGGGSGGGGSSGGGSDDGDNHDAGDDHGGSSGSSANSGPGNSNDDEADDDSSDDNGVDDNSNDDNGVDDDSTDDNSLATSPACAGRDVTNTSTACAG